MRFGLTEKRAKFKIIVAQTEPSSYQDFVNIPEVEVLKITAKCKVYLVHKLLIEDRYTITVIVPEEDDLKVVHLSKN